MEMCPTGWQPKPGGLFSCSNGAAAVVGGEALGTVQVHAGPADPEMSLVEWDYGAPGKAFAGRWFGTLVLHSVNRMTTNMCSTGLAATK